ncbi:MAG TPA: serpin family protein [Gemmatimonadaceae bacterium]|nr:serpin family protein [Gemmatimonadaceae bacterium]
MRHLSRQTRSSARRHTPFAFCTAAAALLLAACSMDSTAPGPISALPRALTSGEQSLISASNSFAFSLLRQLNHDTPPDSNIFISPLSASMALGMTMNGAAGTTLDSMRAVLGYAGMPVSDIDESYKGLIDLLRGLDSRVDFRIANSIWYRQDIPFNQSFLDAGKQFFDAEVAAVDFSDPATIGTINDWVNTSTAGRIPVLVQSLPSTMAMYLANAIYFKGTWVEQFDTKRTAPFPFTKLDGSTMTVQMMQVDDSVPAISTPAYQAVDLPYGGGAYAMLVVVPEPGHRVDSLLASFTPGDFHLLIAGLSVQKGKVLLPRFQLTWKDSLNHALTALGMGIAFGPDADFTNMSTALGHRLAITSVDQSTFVKVDEEGTVAAAATGVGMGVTSGPTPLLQADHPFFFAIHERLSGTILFVGKVATPPSA